MAKLKKQTALKGRSQSGHDKFATGLGWFSIGLGLTELFAGRAVARFLGMDGHETLIRAYGVRELATGIAILTSPDPEPFVWGRVGGDVLDLATLATGLEGDNPQKGNVGVAIGFVVGATVLDVMCAQGLSSEKGDRFTAIADYGDRSGFPRPAASMRGDADDFEVPSDFRIPTPLRPYTTG